MDETSDLNPRSLGLKRQVGQLNDLRRSRDRRETLRTLSDLRSALREGRNVMPYLLLNAAAGQSQPYKEVLTAAGPGRAQISGSRYRLRASPRKVLMAISSPLPPPESPVGLQVARPLIESLRCGGLLSVPETRAHHQAQGGDERHLQGWTVPLFVTTMS